MALAYFVEKVIFMREAGKMVKCMEQAQVNGLAEVMSYWENTLENIKMELKKDMVSILILED